MTDAVLDRGDAVEAVAQAILDGKSLRLVRRELSLTEGELDAVLEKLWPLDQAARLRAIRGDLARLDRLIEKFYLKAISGEGCVNSAAVAIKAAERKAALLGLDAVQRIDLQVMRPAEISSHEKIKAAIMSMVEREQPERRAAIRRLDQLGPQRVLEMLGPYEGDTDGTEPWPEDIALRQPEPK